MAGEDRARWNRRHREQGPGIGEAPAALVELTPWLPRRGRALDVAGGKGANALCLSKHGLDVTLVDVSDQALEFARARAEFAGVGLELVRADLECDPLPPGPWALVLCSHYLQPSLMPQLAALLEPAGRLIWIHPTTTNLERHTSPSARYLLQPGQARAIVEAAGLRLRSHEEGWLGGRHLARIVAERPAAVDSVAGGPVVDRRP